MTPFEVRAHLATGLAHAAPWATSLDGLLASEMWEDEKAAARDRGNYLEAAGPDEVPADLDLPLARCTLAGGDDWHWYATCAYPEDGTDAPEIHHWSGRPDHRALEQLARYRPSVISDRQGRYRARQMPLLLTSTRTVLWRGVGDIDRVSTTLASIDAIGKKRSQGEGHVLRWEVQPVDIDAWSAGHLHPNGLLGRLSPRICLQGRPTVETGGVGRGAIRPPHMHRSRMREVCMPWTPH